MPEVETELTQRLASGEEVVLATVIRLNGEPPSRTGAKALFDRDTQLAGTLGCSEFDSQARADAPALLTIGTPDVRTYRHDLGSIDVYVEPYIARPTLLVFAATPIAEALVRWANEVGFRATLVPHAADVPAAQAGELYVVHTNHDAPDLVEALEAVLPRNPRFIGLVGSRRHTGHHLEALRAKGVPGEVISRIQSPVGLDLGSRTPAEIALSILAGLVAVRRGGRAGWKAS
jgi:xanthine dehydrogenase accessory factor